MHPVFQPTLSPGCALLVVISSQPDIRPCGMGRNSIPGIAERKPFTNPGKLVSETQRTTCTIDCRSCKPPTLHIHWASIKLCNKPISFRETLLRNAGFKPLGSERVHSAMLSTHVQEANGPSKNPSVTLAHSPLLSITLPFHSLGLCNAKSIVDDAVDLAKWASRIELKGDPILARTFSLNSY